MFIDNEGRLFGKINIIDLIVILVIIGAVVGTFYKFNKAKVGPMVKQNDVMMKFYAEEIPEIVAKNVETGVSASDDEKMVSLGEITEVKVDEAFSYETNSEGQYVKSSKPDFKSLLITVRVKGVLDNNGSTISGINYGIGHTMYLKAGKTRLRVKVYDIDKYEE